MQTVQETAVHPGSALKVQSSILTIILRCKLLETQGEIVWLGGRDSNSCHMLPKNRADDLRAQELCQTSQCGQITYGRSTPIDSARAVASGHSASRAAGRTGTAAVGLQFKDADTLQETSTTRPRRRGFSSRSCAVAISATCVGSNHEHALLGTVAPRARRTLRIHMNTVEVSSLRPTPEERE